ncbi:hypothetical protein [Haloprofundus halobius]|uniref:hypothetical protein n=1 Tax=Haloprofundus halobius TaxID=2876194 RepID=UPI001CC9F059|nr:hypothetical protein [Haloprofundus halobius]
MSKDIPTRERSTRERGTYAGHNEDPTLASYLSSLFFLLSVPTFVGLAYAGFYAGYYGESAIVPVFGGLLVVAIAVAFAAMHFKR